ncbi:diguanylate cyclase [Alteromonas sp. 345S023]|uniref:Diguanylate cyclase n=2 Tax=Alteromonas profundi TaxID=2696062 RepID=A0A7X5LID5_9ALTE|nr:diguanylate cyclase [Alteromonas profundi]
MFEATFEHCAVGLAHVSPNGNFIRVNKKLSEFLGYDVNTLTNMSYQDITVDTHLEKDNKLVAKVLSGELDNYSLEKKYHHAAGHEVWGKLTVSLVRDEAGEPDYFISVVEDIDKMKKVEMELFQAEALFSEIVSAFSSRTYIWVAPPDFSRLYFANEGFQNIFGRDLSVLSESPLAFVNFVHPEDFKRVSKFFNRKRPHSWDMQYRIICPEGEVKHIHDRGIPLYDEDKKLSLIAGTADDITKVKHQEEALVDAIAELDRLTKTDVLTGIANRREIFLQIEQTIKMMKRDTPVSTLVYLDLDNFKNINDTYGHQAGDEALVAFANMLADTLRETDKLARIGGDEFVLLLSGSNTEEAEVFFERLLSMPFKVRFDSGEEIQLSFSLGWAEWRSDITSAQAWLDAADKAMFSQKRQHHEDAGYTDVC